MADGQAVTPEPRPSRAPLPLQGSADLNTYKLFLETAHHLLAEDGRLGMLLPSGIYTDKGTTALRKHFLERCSWEWCYGFENRLGVFPIHRSFKFVPIIVQRGGSTEAVNAAFMRHDVGEWERPDEHAVQLAVSGIRRFAPATWSFMELGGDRDLELIERLYAKHPLLGEAADRLGGRYVREFDMTNAARHFVARRKLEGLGLLGSDDETRDPRVRARLRSAGYVPLYEGKSFWLNDPYFLGRGNAESVSKFVPVATVRQDSKARPGPARVSA